MRGFTYMRSIALLVMLSSVMFSSGCATIRVTDPPRTATEQFLLSQAAARAIEQLSTEVLADRVVFVETGYLSPTPLLESQEFTFLLGELRARLLMHGVRLARTREEAQVILEVRSGGVGIDRLEYLLGIPATYAPGVAATAGVPATATPELAIVKSTRQMGYASIAFVAYWADTGEVLHFSGPALGQTQREDFWLFGTGPRTVGDIPTVEWRRR